MKTKWNHLLAFILILLVTTCKQETNYSEELRNLVSIIQNNVARQLLCQMENQPGAYEAFLDALQKDAASFELTVLSSSPQYEVHYALPYSRNGIIEGCIIYPINVSSAPNNKKSLGMLKTPIRIDLLDLNAMPNNHKYLLSVLFLQWEESGAKINSDLSFYARNINNEDNDHIINIPNRANNLPSISTRGYGDAVMDATIFLDYKTTSASRYNPYEEDLISVTVPHPNTIAQTTQNFMNDDYRVVDAWVEHRMGQRLYITISFNNYMTQYEFKEFMSDIMRSVSAYYSGNSGDVVFSSYYTYTFNYHSKNQDPVYGSGSNGPSEVHKGEGGTNTKKEDKKPTKNRPAKTPEIYCDDIINRHKSNAIHAFEFLDKVKRDDNYSQYIEYSDYINTVKQNDSLEHSTSLLEFDTPEGEKLYRCTPINTGKPNSVDNDTGSSNLALIIHNHPNGDPPSFTDVITTANICSRKNMNKFQGCLVYNSTENLYYMIYVTDKDKATHFFDEYCQEVNPRTNWIIHNGRLKDVLDATQKSFKKLTQFERMIYTLSFIFSEHDAGMSLIQIDSNNQGTVFYCNEKMKDLNKYHKYIIPYKCR